jgi:hypothetical protein
MISLYIAYAVIAFSLVGNTPFKFGSIKIIKVNGIVIGIKETEISYGVRINQLLILSNV